MMPQIDVSVPELQQLPASQQHLLLRSCLESTEMRALARRNGRQVLRGATLVAVGVIAGLHAAGRGALPATLAVALGVFILAIPVFLRRQARIQKRFLRAIVRRHLNATAGPAPETTDSTDRPQP